MKNLNNDIAGPQSTLLPVTDLFRLANLQLQADFTPGSKPCHLLTSSFDFVSNFKCVSVGNIAVVIEATKFDEVEILAFYKICHVEENFLGVALADNTSEELDANKFFSVGYIDIKNGVLPGLLMANETGFESMKLQNAFKGKDSVKPLVSSGKLPAAALSANSISSTPLGEPGVSSSFIKAERASSLAPLRRLLGGDEKALSLIVNLQSMDLNSPHQRNFFRMSLPDWWYQSGRIPAVKEDANVYALAKLNFSTSEDKAITGKVEFQKNNMIISNFAPFGKIEKISDLQSAMVNVIALLQTMSETNQNLPADRWPKNFANLMKEFGEFGDFSINHIAEVNLEIIVKHYSKALGGLSLVLHSTENLSDAEVDARALRALTIDHAAMAKEIMALLWSSGTNPQKRGVEDEDQGIRGGSGGRGQKNKKAKSVQQTGAAVATATGGAPATTTGSNPSKFLCIDEMLHNLKLSSAACARGMKCKYDHAHLTSPLSVTDKAKCGLSVSKMRAGPLKQSAENAIK